MIRIQLPSRGRSPAWCAMAMSLAWYTFPAKTRSPGSTSCCPGVTLRSQRNWPYGSRRQGGVAGWLHP
jgi:hypothetical protein